VHFFVTSEEIRRLAVSYDRDIHARKQPAFAFLFFFPRFNSSPALVAAVRSIPMDQLIK